jgi:hypothetical protein
VFPSLLPFLQEEVSFYFGLAVFFELPMKKGVSVNWCLVVSSGHF